MTMAAYKKFAEYLDTKGKLVEKPVEDPKADTAPEPPAVPEEPVKKGRNWEAKAAVKGKQQPYVGPGKDKGPQKGEKGFAQEGDKKLVYEPDDKGKTMSTWPKGKTEQFLQDTKGMSVAQLAEYLKEQHRVDEDVKLSDTPLQVLGQAAKLASKNDNLLNFLVQEIYKAGGFPKLVDNIFEREVAYWETAILLSEPKNGAVKTQRLLRAIKEVTAPPAAETETDEKPKKKKEVPAGKEGGDPKDKDLPDQKKRRPETIEDEPADVGDSPVVATRGSGLPPGKM